MYVCGVGDDWQLIKLIFLHFIQHLSRMSSQKQPLPNNGQTKIICENDVQMEEGEFVAGQILIETE